MLRLLSRSIHASRVLGSKRDYYEILGVSRDASKSDVKKQYYKLAKKYHPDANKDDPQAAKKFAEATEAWEVLGDEEKRGQYDTFGHQEGQSGFDGAGFEDIFSSMFGQRQQRPNAAMRGADIQMTARLSFMEAVKGTTRDLNVVSNTECDTCHGTGAKPGTKPTTCKHCNGSGVEVIQQGFFSVESPCRRCHGQGKTISHPCSTCSGRGTVKKPRQVTVTIPPGVDNGMNLRLAHQGEAGTRGGPAGHLYVGIEVMPDPFFRREGTNVHVEVPISIAQAILGGTVVIPTLTGEAELKIPKGVQPNTTLKMSGRGIPQFNSNKVGAQMVLLKVHIPR